MPRATKETRSLSRLTDRLSQVLGLRPERRLLSFRGVYESLYVDLQEMHENYVYMLEYLRADLESGVDLDTIAGWLSAARATAERRRTSLIQRALQLSDSDKTREGRAFLISIYTYFQAQYFEPEPLVPETMERNKVRPGSKTVASMPVCGLQAVLVSDRFAFSGDGAFTRRQLTSEARKALRVLRHNWNRISRRYSRLPGNS